MNTCHMPGFKNGIQSYSSRNLYFSHTEYPCPQPPLDFYVDMSEELQSKFG